ncbi:MAG: KpsF/GutQ family sugar-phosphate isomerase [Gammaproteobacteria bacterium]|nr:KpsF/GutQ family sugar-phosphate isomerase [Gammaproteobacteria bacterium]
MNNDVNRAQSMFAQYAEAMQATANLLDLNFQRAVDTVAQLDALLIITGLGKSGLVGQKAAATFSSTGTRAVFVHPVEALHGDSGVIEPGAALLAISKGGGNVETIEFTRQFKTVAHGPVMTLTEPNSNLESYGDIALNIPKLPEIDEWDLAPTTSTITSLSVCDILAICVQQQRGLTAEHFAQFHPHGTLGKRLLLHVRDFMVSGDALPLQSVKASFSKLLYEISSKGLGSVLLINDDASFHGMITDGDIRRLLEREEDITKLNAHECYQLSRRGTDLPQVSHGTTSAETMAIDCLKQMQMDRITALVVLDENKPIGIIRLQDLIAAGL